MFKLLGIIIKSGIFALIVLVLAHVVKVGDQTISDQVKTKLSHAERSEIAGKVRSWAGKVSDDARQGFKTQMKHTGQAPRAAAAPAENISSSERQKLKDLLQELNGSSR